MMKKIYLLVATVLCFTTIYAQKKSYSVDHGDKGYSVHTLSSGLNLTTIDDRISVLTPELKRAPASQKNTYPVSIEIEGEWFIMYISDGEGFADEVRRVTLEDGIYKNSLPEGYYDIAVLGDKGSDTYGFLIYEQVHVNADLTLTYDMADSDKKVTFNPVDRNGVSFTGTAVTTFRTFMYYEMDPSVMIRFGVQYDHETDLVEEYAIYINDLGERGKLYSSFDIFSTDDVNYFIRIDADNEITEDVVFENGASDLKRLTQHINIDKDLPGDSYSYLASVTLLFTENEIHESARIGVNTARTLDRDKPYVLYTNTKIPGEIIKGQYMDFTLPILYNYLPDGDPFNTGSKVSLFPVGVNDDGQLVRNYLSYFDAEYFWNAKDELINIITSPLTKAFDQGTDFYACFSAPRLRFTSYTFKADSPEGEATVGAGLVYFGENNEQLIAHRGMPVYAKSGNIDLFTHQSDEDFGFSYLVDNNVTDVKITTTNDKIFAYGRRMLNHAEIEFDLSREDVMTPKLSMLRVVDGDGNVKIGLEDIENAVLEISAGDFDVDPIYFNNVFSGTPDVKVEWTADGSTFYPLEAVEDPSKFDAVGGNFFTVSLSPVSGEEAMNKWITVAVTLTDDAGNTMKQTLDPLFYTGEEFSAIENITNDLNHRAYPNPFTGIITVDADHPVSGETYFEIYDISGKIVSQQKINCNQTTSFSWNGSHAAPGVYFYAIYTLEGTMKGKIIKK